jgi:hypothetical protein
VHKIFGRRKFKTKVKPESFGSRNAGRWENIAGIKAIGKRQCHPYV